MYGQNHYCHTLHIPIYGRFLSYFIRVYLSDPSSSKKRPRNEKVEWNVSEVEEIVECCGTYIELLRLFHH